jgi:hypothetical protein
MSQDAEQQMLDTLREIRDGQREIVRLLTAQQSVTEEQVRRSRETIAESVGLQKLALQRQKTVTVIAVAGIVACLAAIAYLVLRYL